MFKKSTKILVIILITIIVTTGFSFNLNSKKTEINKNFSIDVVKSLHEIYLSRGNEDKNENFNEYEFAYSMKEHLSKAKHIMEKWETSEDQFIIKVTDNMIEGIDTLLIAADLLINLIEYPSNDEEALALIRIKLDSGREKIMTAASGLVLDGEGINLNKKQKTEVLNYTQTLFKDSLNEYSEYLRSNKNEKEYKQEEEIWAAIFITTKLYNKTNE
ncbi:hypothetical protein GF354_01965 [Candidatus Peregrinibacteria bacterium]|nr:hypothetical protein [Candidatus Peregrinibacteria bacterium]